jgi:hypothetical protein
MMSFLERLNIRRLGVYLFIFALFLSIAGHFDQYGTFSLKQLFDDYYANLGAELASIALTILLIDRLNEARDEKHEKERLIRHMGSHYNMISLQAVEELHLLGWLEDGTVKHAYLGEADLHHANMPRANLDGAYMVRTNLEGARLLESRMQDAEMFQINLRNSNLQRANLRHANLAGAQLQGADLRDANVQDANLAGADLRGANLLGANLTFTKLQNADLTHALVTEQQLAQVEMLQGAVLPTGQQYDGRFNLVGDQKAMVYQSFN